MTFFLLNNLVQNGQHLVSSTSEGVFQLCDEIFPIVKAHLAICAQVESSLFDQLSLILHA